MLFLILRQNLQRFVKTFYLLITLCEVLEWGDFDVGIFLLLVLVILGSTEVELVAVTPLRTKDFEARKEQ